MYSEKLNDLVNKNYINILKRIIKEDEENFKKDVLSLNEENNSLFISLVKNFGMDENFIKELYELLNSYGYSLLSKNKELSEFGDLERFYINYTYIKTKKIEDFMYLLNQTTNSKVGDYLINKAIEEDPNIISKLEKEGLNIFRFAASKLMVGHITLEGFEKIGEGVSENLIDISKDHVLYLLERKDSAVKLYWELKNKKNKDNNEEKNNVMSQEEFGHFVFLYAKKIRSIATKNSLETNNIKNWVEDSISRLTDSQKYKILELSVSSKDPKLLKGLVKSFNKTYKSEEVQDIILSNLRESSNLDYLKLFLNKKSFIKILPNGSFGFEKISDFLSKNYLSFNFSDKKYSFSKDGKINLMISDLLREDFKGVDYNFLLEPLKKLDVFNKETIIDYCSEKFKDSLLLNMLTFVNVGFNNDFLFSFKEIKKEDLKNGIFKEEGKREIQEFLDKTWLKEVNGKRNFEKVGFYRLGGLEVFNKEVLINCLREDQKEILFESFFNNEILRLYNINSNSFIKLNDNIGLFFKETYDKFKEDKNFNWNKLNLKEEAMESIKDTELYFEIKAMKFSCSLNKELSNKEEKRDMKRMKL